MKKKCTLTTQSSEMCSSVKDAGEVLMGYIITRTPVKRETGLSMFVCFDEILT